MTEAIGYFSSEKIYKKMFRQFKGKIESFGRVGGNIDLEEYTTEELEPVALFFGISPAALKKKNKLSLQAFERQLQKTKFEGVGLHELLETYFSEPIRSKKSVKDEKRKQEEETLSIFTADYPLLADYLRYLGERNSDSHWIIRMLLADDFRPVVRHLAKVNENLPEVYERLPFFSQRITGDPHTFDLSTVNGKLLIHFLHFKLTETGAVPTQTEAINELLLNFRILRDDITNFVSFANLLGEQKGAVHPVWQAAVETGTAVNMPLRELLKINNVVPLAGYKVYVVENSGVFSSLLDLAPHAPLVCTHGQFKLAGLRLIDFLAASGCQINYAGDFDPEGVAMAVRLLERHPENVQLWRMDANSYVESVSSVELGERLGKLNNISHPIVAELIKEMNRVGKVGYQEALLEKMAGDLSGYMKSNLK